MKAMLWALVFVSMHNSYAITINIPADYGTIQQAIDASSDGDVIVAANGWYMELINFNGKNITLTSNHFTTGDTLDIQNTVLYGGQFGSVVTFENQETRGAVLNGFTISFGQADNGGAIQCLGSSPTLTNLVVTQNHAWSSGGGIHIDHLAGEEVHVSNPLLRQVTVLNNESSERGAGISCLNNSTVDMSNIYIVNNDFTNPFGYGSAIYASDCSITLDSIYVSANGELECEYGTAFFEFCDVEIVNSVFCYNHTNRGGAGILVEGGSLSLRSTRVDNNHTLYHDNEGTGLSVRAAIVLIDSCIIELNTSSSGSGGGIGLTAGSCVEISNSFISNNYMEHSNIEAGGGIYMDASELVLNNCDVTENSARHHGGGLFGSNSQLTVVNSRFRQNESRQAGYHGGAMYLVDCDALIRTSDISLNATAGRGGAIYARGSGTLRMETTVSAQNQAGDKGGAYCFIGLDPILVNCTIAGNQAASHGGAFYLSTDANAGLVNTIVHSNLPQQLYMNAAGSPCSAKMTHCDIEGGLPAIETNDNGLALWLDGNIDEDPLFSESYALEELSPCIDAGISYVNWLGEVIVDLQPEDFYGAAPDMGAVENDVPGIHSSVNGLDFGFIDLYDTDTLTVDLINNSDQEIVIAAVGFAGLAYTCDLVAGTTLPASASLSVEVYFHPTAMITYVDTLTVGWDAHLLQIDLRGSANATPAQVRNVEIQMVNASACLSWDPVTQTINGDPLVPTGYVVYCSTHSNDVMSFFAFVTEPQILHYLVGQFNEQKFYAVTAYVGDLDIINQVIEGHPDFNLGELPVLLEEQKLLH